MFGTEWALGMGEDWATVLKGVVANWAAVAILWVLKFIEMWRDNHHTSITNQRYLDT